MIGKQPMFLLITLGVIVPTVLLFLGMLGKKIVAGGDFSWSDWFLGLEFTLATVVASALNLSDLYRLATRADDVMEKAEAELAKLREEEQKTRGHGNHDALVKIATQEEKSRFLREMKKENKTENGWSIICLVFSLVSFCMAAIVHRKWESQPEAALAAHEIRSKRIQLVAVMLLGYACMLIYMLGVKGVS